MGQNLALNIADHGFRISVYNRTTATMEKFVAENPDTPGGLVGRPRWKNSPPVAQAPAPIGHHGPGRQGHRRGDRRAHQAFEPGDIIIDGGNAKWTDTIRREKELEGKGFPLHRQRRFRR
jgi:6-phosphogluconate dehydrogenase